MIVKLKLLIVLKKTEQEELVEDLIQIITDFSFCSKDKRVNNAKNSIKELVDKDDNI